MANGNVPPQAYTREMLTTAFNWLQSQPEPVKKLATTPDSLVGLYRRAQRYGSVSLEADAPVSSQTFMSDLKNLAEGLKQFEEPAPQPKPTPVAAPPPAGASANFQPQMAREPQHSAAVAPSMASSVAGLNDRSRQMLQEVRISLNLSSDAEAMNLMVALAYKNLKSLLA
ncbi:MAG TPA: hypothetical protein VM432_06525 [Bdellovibrionales bacterium]|nr:hypothetical protein [Bdellovibrionales bacterium]